MPELAKLEAEIMEEANRLGVGAMGFGGKASLIGCKITAANRLPASFFVSVAYDCWAFRRLGVTAGCADRRDHELAVSRSGRVRWSEMARGEGLPADGPRGGADAAADRRADAGAEGRRRGADQRRDVHRPRRRARVPDEESAAGGSERRGAVPLRSGDAEGRRPVDR